MSRQNQRNQRGQQVPSGPNTPNQAPVGTSVPSNPAQAHVTINNGPQQPSGMMDYIHRRTEHDQNRLVRKIESVHEHLKHIELNNRRAHRDVMRALRNQGAHNVSDLPDEQAVDPAQFHQIQELVVDLAKGMRNITQILGSQQKQIKIAFQCAANCNSMHEDTHKHIRELRELMRGLVLQENGPHKQENEQEEETEPEETNQ